MLVGNFHFFEFALKAMHVINCIPALFSLRMSLIVQHPYSHAGLNCKGNKNNL